MIATNFHGDPPAEADLAIHHSNVDPTKPYIESEGSPANVPGNPHKWGYWGDYSKTDGFYGYLNVGVYTQPMKESQYQLTRQHLANGRGYMLASTWLQAGPPQGPNHRPGGMGTEDDPGVRWWLEWLKVNYGPYIP
jgi:hypothetical protein